MSCEQIDEQMVDFLYGELAPDARAAFESHLTGCERCRREVESLGHTRTLARASLDEAPPSHLRARIVDAARAARVKAAPETVSLWHKLRAWWTLPTLATVGALAVFLLGSRLFLEPRKVEQRGRVVSGEAPAGAPVAQDVPEPETHVTAPAPAETSRRAPSHKMIGDDDGIGATRGAAGGGAEAEKKSDKRKGAASASGPASRRRDIADKEGIRGALEGTRDQGAPPSAGAAAPVARSENRRPTDHMAVDDLAEEREAPTAAAPAAEAAAMAPEPSAPSRSRAVAPLAKKSPRRESAEAEESDLGADESGRQPAARASGKGYPAPAARAPAAPAPAAAVAATGSAPEPPPPPPAPAKAASAAPSKDLRAAAKPKAATGRAETLVQRADRLFTEGRWVEAAVAYRDLLRQDPNSPDAPRWRSRAAAADSAAAATTRPQQP